MGVCDYMEEAEENVHHVNDGGNAMDAVIWIEVGGTTDGGDECILGKEETWRSG